MDKSNKLFYGKTMTTVDEYFRAALQKLITKSPKGIKTALAENIKISYRYIDLILQGKRNPGKKTGEKIAEFFDMTYDDMIRLGRAIIEKETMNIMDMGAMYSFKTQNFYKKANLYPKIFRILADLAEDGKEEEIYLSLKKISKK